jgi:peroxin-16
MDILKNYDSYILKNAAQISSIESALRTITYILPSTLVHISLANRRPFQGCRTRFRNSYSFATMLLMVVYTTLNLVSLYHDSLLARAVANLPPTVRKPEPSPHNRYTQFWTKASPSYKRLALAIVVIQYAEVLLEMGAKKKWGDKGRWRTIVGIEALKSLTPTGGIDC